jgi:hypothetical protein
MDEQYYLKSLKRLYDEGDKSQRREDVQAVNGIIKAHTELLPELKDRFPENEVIQSIEEVDFTETYKGVAPENIREVQTVKMNALRMADSLGVEVDNFEEQASNEGMTVIHVNQSVDQSVDVSINTVTQLVNNLPREETQKENLREIIEEYHSELQSENPDTSVLKELIDEARELSKDVAVKLAIVGLRKGIDILS